MSANVEISKNVRAYPPFFIGNIEIDPPIVLAPMAGVTNRAHRTMCREMGGVGLVTTEMVSVYALRMAHKRTRTMLDWKPSERPVCVQIFGAHPDAVADGAKIVEEAGADIIDINFGCPVPKVTKSGSGAALLHDLPKLEEIVKAAVGAVKVPVTVKTRRGWNSSLETALEVARIVEGSGGAAICVHGRTAVQMYTGQADWDIIRRVKESVSIPVIGNGDVRSPEDAKRLFDETGCDGVMIGRAALGNPWIFSRVHTYLETGVLVPEPDPLTRIEGARMHGHKLAGCKGEDRAVREMRGHIAWYLKGYPGAAALRSKIMEASSLEEIEQVLDEARSKCELRVVEG